MVPVLDNVLCTGMDTRGVETRQATVDDLDLLVPLFDAYRQFYRQPSEPERAQRFLLDRFENNQSGHARPLHLMSFSSGAMARIFILNDLFVSPEARCRGAGHALLRAAAEYGRRVGALRLALSTEVTNTTAQSLYESVGWKRDTVFCSYQLTL